MELTNSTGISLPLAVWLANDNYDFTPGDLAISATSLMKPVRQIVLGNRITDEKRQAPDVSDFLAARLGNSIHDGIEQAWKFGYKKSLAKLGYPQDVIDRIRINPVMSELEDNPNTLPVWIEQRAEREIMGFTVSGKFDLVLGGVLQDYKSTSVWSWIMGNKDKEYSLQGSLYRWLHPDKITGDSIHIQFIFTDWSAAQARQQPDKYPAQRVKQHIVPLMSLEETDAWIRAKITAIQAATLLSEAEIPECTDKELWRSNSIYKYFKDPAKINGRSTRNFPSLAEANTFRAEKGVGTVLTVKGKVKACGYCPAFDICKQKDKYDLD